jgi:hypothetical protein
MSDAKSSVPIPQQFLNSETLQPFEKCLMCSQSLKQIQYVVEKAIKNYPSLGTSEIIFEYAICLSCATKTHMELSEESRTRIQAYMADHLKNRQPNPEKAKDLDSSLSRCMIKETDLSQSSEYSVYALCNGSEMIINELPYALSGEVQDEIMQLLSAKSLDIMDDFIGNHFSGPPEVMEILKRRPVFI